MRRQDLILNLLLTLSLGGLTWKLHRDWENYSAHNGPQALEILALRPVSVPPPLAAPDYTAVARLNPFHPDRNDIIQQPAAQVKPIGPPPLIYGSVILGDTRFALMATEQSPEPQRVSEGSTFEGYRLVKVLPESVILESAAGRDEIMLYNALMRLHRQGARTVASAAPHPGAPVPVVSSGSSSLPGQGQAYAANGGTTASPAASTIPAMAVPPGKEVLQTPFGPILIEKRQ